MAVRRVVVALSATIVAALLAGCTPSQPAPSPARSTPIASSSADASPSTTTSPAVAKPALTCSSAVPAAAIAASVGAVAAAVGGTRPLTAMYQGGSGEVADLSLQAAALPEAGGVTCSWIGSAKTGRRVPTLALAVMPAAKSAATTAAIRSAELTLFGAMANDTKGSTSGIPNGSVTAFDSLDLELNVVTITVDADTVLIGVPGAVATAKSIAADVTHAIAASAPLTADVPVDAMPSTVGCTAITAGLQAAKGTGGPFRGRVDVEVFGGDEAFAAIGGVSCGFTVSGKGPAFHGTDIQVDYVPGAGSQFQQIATAIKTEYAGVADFAPVSGIGDGAYYLGGVFGGAGIGSGDAVGDYITLARYGDDLLYVGDTTIATAQGPSNPTATAQYDAIVKALGL